MSLSVRSSILSQAALICRISRSRSIFDQISAKNEVIGVIHVPRPAISLCAVSGPATALHVPAPHTVDRPHCARGSERRFLLSLVAGAPEWSLLGIAHLEHLPGLRWKLRNLAQLQKANARKFAGQAEALASRLTSATTAL